MGTAEQFHYNFIAAAIGRQNLVRFAQMGYKTLAVIWAIQDRLVYIVWGIAFSGTKALNLPPAGFDLWGGMISKPFVISIHIFACMGKAQWNLI